MALDLWYKNSVIYSLNVGSFMDADADGVGDFRGLTDRLDHISNLGANCIWLMPFFPSPRLDYGYDVENYYAVSDDYGSLGDSLSSAGRRRCAGSGSS